VRFATLEDDFWRLDSAVERHRAHPDQFWIPDVTERTSLQPGDLAQLRFEIEVDEGVEVNVQAERMWVCVREVTSWGYMGVLTNTPGGYEESGRRLSGLRRGGPLHGRARYRHRARSGQEPEPVQGSHARAETALESLNAGNGSAA
jgi:hypothetical protein